MSWDDDLGVYAEFEDFGDDDLEVEFEDYDFDDPDFDWDSVDWDLIWDEYGDEYDVFEFYSELS